METIIRVEKNRQNPYVMIRNSVFEDPLISWKAKGLMGYFLSRPDNWQINVRDLVQRSTDGRDSVYATLRELRSRGYLLEVISRHPRGYIQAREYHVFEVPQLDPGKPDQVETPESRTALAIPNAKIAPTNTDLTNIHRLSSPSPTHRSLRCLLRFRRLERLPRCGQDGQRRIPFCGPLNRRNNGMHPLTDRLGGLGNGFGVAFRPTPDVALRIFGGIGVPLPRPPGRRSSSPRAASRRSPRPPTNMCST